jgi:L-alanine-DL-glutamate epimerase-like enolase superfamily enzyme
VLAPRPLPALAPDHGRVLLTVATDDGVEGHAFLGSAMRGAHLDGESLIQALKPLVMGQEPLERERLYQAMWQRNRATTLRAIGAMDVALWDIAGKVAGLPIHRLLGSYRDRVPAYASSAVLPSMEAYAEEAARAPARLGCEGQVTRNLVGEPGSAGRGRSLARRGLASALS